MTLLEVRGLHKHYQGSRGLAGFLTRRQAPVVRAVDGISFSVARHEMLALVGESGCGKTTTAQTVLRLLSPSAGGISFRGEDITELGQHQLRPLRQSMQIVYQDPYEALDPRYRVGQTVGEPLQIHGIGASKQARNEIVMQALERVELSPASLYGGRFPHQLSGGQRQRAAIAAALVVSPELLVADEPVSMLDVSMRAGVMNLLSGLCHDGMGVLMITHDLALAANFADRIAVMYLGRLVETGIAREVLASPQHPYTRALLDVTPRHRAGNNRLGARILGGEVPNAAAIPAGCRFRPRCPIAEEQCAVIDPALHVVTAGTVPHEAACLLAPTAAGASAADAAAGGGLAGDGVTDDQGASAQTDSTGRG
jgi:oligopeptide/dipeptide ABC transporter ATP-binding protein